MTRKTMGNPKGKNTKPWFLGQFLAILAIVSLVPAGCSPVVDISPTGKAAENEIPSESEPGMANTASIVEVKSLTVEQLWNGLYQSDLSQDGVAKLDAGEFHQRTTTDGVTELFIRLVESKFVDLDRDGTDDAIVVLVSDPGGSGTFYELAAVLNRSGEPEHVASEPLGDRIKIQSFVIQDSRIVIEMVTHGPDDPMCCPTQVVRNTYVFEDNILSLESSEIIGEE